MQHELDAYARLSSPIHAWNARLKLIGLFALVVVFSLVQQLILLPAILLIAIVLFALSRLPFSYLMNRLKYPGFFLLSLAILLPLIAGETVLAQVGPIAIKQEGLLQALVIGARFVAIITVMVVLFGSMPFLTVARTLRSLGLPDILVDMLLLTYRYIFEAAEDLTRMQRAMRLRGFQGSKLNRHTVTHLSSLIGGLLVRSYDRADRIYNAMRLRGYGAGIPMRIKTVTKPNDVVYFVFVLILSISLIASQIWLTTRLP